MQSSAPSKTASDFQARRPVSRDAFFIVEYRQKFGALTSTDNVLLCRLIQKAPMKKARSFIGGEISALILFFGVAATWLLSSGSSPGRDWSSVKDLLPGHKDAETYFQSGLRDLQSGARQVAIDDFTKAIELDPSFTPAYDARATVRLQMKDFAGAIADSDKVIGLAHDDEHVYLIKGACRYYLHDIQDALKPLNTAVLMNTNDPVARDIRGAVLAESRQWDDAIADFNKAIELNPDDAKAYYGRAAAELLLKEYEKSLADASDAIELDSTLSEAYGLRASAKSRLKDRAGAFADANTRIQMDTSDFKGYVARAGLEGLWDDFSAASNDLQTAIQINPTNSGIYVCRGMIEQKSGNLQAAIAEYSQGLLDNTEAMRAASLYDSMAHAYAEMGRWQPALENFHKAMAYNSPPDGAHFEVFLIECRLGQPEQAKKELAAYIQSIPAVKAHDWTTSIANYLAGSLNETDFLDQASSTAKRPTDIPMQTDDALYLTGMQHLLAGDKIGAWERFKKCLKVGDDNSDDYMMAKSIVGH
jgi:tetratricopeptide (TPR) repeat protein